MDYTVMGVDLGFVQTKATTKTWQTKFSSLVKPRSETSISGLEDSEGALVAFEGKSYNVGVKGSYDFNADRLNSATDIAKLLTVFGTYHKVSMAQDIHLLVSGLPVYEFNNYRETVASKLKSSFVYDFNGRGYRTNVLNTLVIPQSAGAYYDYILDNEGELKEDRKPSILANENVLVLDIGGRTTDGCIMEASKYSQGSFTIFQGVWKAQNELRRLILKEHQYNMTPLEVDAVMRTGQLPLGSGVIEVGELVRKAVGDVYPEMRDELTLYVEDFRRYAAVILTGGGASVYGDFFQEDITCPIITTEGAEFANANGYRKYGALILKQE